MRYDCIFKETNAVLFRAPFLYKNSEPYMTNDQSYALTKHPQVSFVKNLEI